MAEQDGSSETEQRHDIVVKDQHGNFYFCPAASIKMLELVEEHPIRNIFGDANLPGVLSLALLVRGDDKDLVIADGQDLVLPGGGSLLP